LQARFNEESLLRSSPALNSIRSLTGRVALPSRFVVPTPTNWPLLAQASLFVPVALQTEIEALSAEAGARWEPVAWPR